MRHTPRATSSKHKDRLESKKVCGPVYKIVCGGGGGEECNETYIGETERSLTARFLEHRRLSSNSSEVYNKDKIEHDVYIDEARILDRDPDRLAKGVQEAILIRAHKPTLNRNGGDTIFQQSGQGWSSHMSRDLTKFL